MRHKIISVIIFLLIGIISGFLIMAQKRVIPERLVNPVSPYQSLVDLKEELSRRQDELTIEIKKQQDAQSAINNQLKNSSPNQKDVVKEINDKESLAGVKPLKGNGVIVTLDDSKRSQTTNDSIIHASDLRDVLNVAWLTSATAAEINGERITASTTIGSVLESITINNKKITNPFAIKIIGDPAALEKNLTGHKQLIALQDRSRSNGLLYHVERSANLEVSGHSGLLITSGDKQ